MSATTLRRLLPLLIMLALPARPENKVGTVTATRNLSLGRFVADAGGAITLTPEGWRSSSGAVILLPGGVVSAASFSLAESGVGTALSWTTISLPQSVTLSSGAASMTLTNFTSNPSHTVIGGAGNTIDVGATLQVGANQPAGNYAGTVSISVNYE